MTLEEKAGQLFHDMICISPNGTLAGLNGTFVKFSTEDFIGKKMMTYFNPLSAIDDVRNSTVCDAITPIVKPVSSKL
jgi:hypothetical protein